MTTWADLKGRLRRALQDTDEDNPSWTTEDLLDYANSALAEISSHTARQKVYTNVPDGQVVTACPLPADYLALGPVQASLQSSLIRQMLKPVERHPGVALPSTVTVTASIIGATYYEWPAGVLNFTRPLPAGVNLYIGYYAYWPKLERDTDQLLVLRWMEEALFWHSQASALAKPGVLAAQIRQYNTRRDSGSPEDNPLLTYARYAKRRYDEILAAHPHQDRSIWEATE